MKALKKKFVSDKPVNSTSQDDSLQKISLVTILYKSEDSISSFLDCLQQQEQSNWVLYVINNASPDKSVGLVSSRLDSRIIIVDNLSNAGFAKAANQGLRAAIAAGSDLVVLINNDIIFGKDFLKDFYNAYVNLKADVISPRIMRIDQPNKSWYTGGTFDDTWVFTHSMHDYDGSASMLPVPVEFATGCCLGISRSTIERIGLLDERFFVYWEDTDFCLRLKNANIPILYVPSLVLYHDGGSSSDGEFSLSYMRLFYRSYMQFVKKHFGLKRATTTALRLWLRERNRSNYGRHGLHVMIRAMLVGLGSRAVKQVRL